LIKGDISNTTTQYVAQRPGAKISLLYIDLDLETPTYYALSALWDRVSKGGLVVFDEYAYHQWSETQGADKFFANKNVKIQALPFSMPTAVVIKE
jgi:predicted O-methyltransferase YrrM